MANKNGLELDFTILHYLLKDKKYSLEIAKETTPEYFDPKLQLFYSIIAEHFQDPDIREVLSVGALLDYCESHNLSEQLERFKVIYNKALGLKLQGEEPKDSDFRYFLKKLKERYTLQLARRGYETMSELWESAPTPDQMKAVYDETIRDIAAVNRIEIFDEGTVGEDASNMYQEYEKIKEDPTDFRGVCVGYNDFDSRSNGLQPGELAVICGLDGSGKSMLMMNMGINAWLGTNNVDTQPWEMAHNGHNVLYFTLEMPRSNKGEPTQASYLNKRILSAVSELELHEIRGGKLNEVNEDKLRRTCEFMETYEKDFKKFHVIDIPRGARVSDIESKYLEVREMMDIDLVIVDYMGIMAADNSDTPDHLAQGAIAAGLHELARMYRFPCITAAQLNRPTGSKGQSLDNQKFNTTRVARSAGISQNANIMMMIESRDEDTNEMKVHITKMRDGRTGEMVLTKAFAKMRIYDGAPYGSTDAEIGTFIDTIPTIEGASFGNEAQI
jgi:replicative DNA helicase